MKNWLALSWSISNRFGWGIYGLNLVLELLRRGKPIPVCLDHITTETLSEEALETLRPVIEFREQNLKHMSRSGQVANLGDTILLHAMGNNMDWSLVSQCFLGEVNVGVIFSEYTDFAAEAKERASRLDGIVAGSTWNADILREQGMEKVAAVFQGVDTTRFRPRPRTGTYDGKFVVFSGGKLDFRKGQDIVLAAFRHFAERHEDAILVTAWQNLWPLTALAFMHAPHLEVMPNVDAMGRLKLTEWAAAHGVSPDRFVDIGMVANEAMPNVLREADLAVFPNRCEGGTNLVAMETMACGIPCVIAANTGQLDLVGEDRCFPLNDQKPVEMPGGGTKDWGESSVEELLEKMEQAYQNRDHARKIGQRGADFMRSWSWPNQIGKLLDTLEDFC